jgi:hypothetical protein
VNAQNCLNRRQCKAFSFKVDYAVTTAFGAVSNTGSLVYDSEEGTPLAQFTPRELNCWDRFQSALVTPYVVRIGNRVTQQIPLLPSSTTSGGGYAYRDFVRLNQNQVEFTFYHGNFLWNFDAAIPSGPYFKDLPSSSYPWLVCLKYDVPTSDYVIDFVAPAAYVPANGTVYARLDSSTSVLNFVQTGLGSGAIFYPGAPNDPDQFDATIPRLFSTKEALTEAGWQRFFCGIEEIPVTNSTCYFVPNLDINEFKNVGQLIIGEETTDYDVSGNEYVTFNLDLDLDPQTAIRAARADNSQCCRVRFDFYVGIVYQFDESGRPMNVVQAKFTDLAIGMNTGEIIAGGNGSAGSCTIEITPTYATATI